MTEQPGAPAITEAELAEALDSFWLFVACAGQRVHGQVADPDEVASVLLATLDRIAAERSPDESAPPVAAALDRQALGQLVHEVRMAYEAERAKAEKRSAFRLGSWEDRPAMQQELDMRIGEAVAAAVQERSEEKEATP